MTFHKPVYLVFALVLLCCSSCSKVTLAYNHGDWLLRYWINAYTSFNARQKEEIQHEVVNYLSWHRQYALPEYIAFLQDMDVLAKRDGVISTADIAHVRTEISRLYRLTMTPFIRPAAHILSTLDSQQIKELRNTLAEKSREQRQEILPGNEQENLAKRADKYIHFTEELVGNLSREQENRIRIMSLNVPFVTTLYMEHLEARQAGLLSLLSNHASEDQIAAFFAQWINAEPAIASPQQQQGIEAFDSAMDEMIARIFGLLTAEQKDHLRKKIAAYISDFQKIHSTT